MALIGVKENIPDSIPKDILELAGVYSENFESQYEYMRTTAESFSAQYSLESALSWLESVCATSSLLRKTEVGVVNVLIHIIGAHTIRLEGVFEAIKHIFRSVRSSLPLVQRKEVVSNKVLKNALKSVFVTVLCGQAMQRLSGFCVSKSTVGTDQNLNPNDIFCLWGEFLDTSGTAIFFIKLLNLIWSKIRAILTEHSESLLKSDSGRFKKLLSRTFHVILKHRDDTFSTMKAQLKSREKEHIKKGQGAGQPASADETVLPAVQILRYFYGTIQALVKLSPGKVAIELMNEFLVERLLIGISFVHPVDGTVNADPVTARMLQGFIHNNTITIFINLCNLDNVHIDEKLGLFRHLRPLIFTNQASREENLLGTISEVSSKENNLKMELVKFEMLLIILRTTPKFPASIVARMVPYLRWTVGLALQQYPVLAISPSQIEYSLNCIMEKSKEKNDFSASFGVWNGNNAQGENKNSTSLFTKLIAAIRLFLLDAPDSIGPALDKLLVEMSAHTSPTCQVLVQSIWSVVFDRRSTEQNVGTIFSMYCAARKMGHCPPAVSLIDTVGNCLVLLGPDEQTIAMQRLFSRFPKVFVAETPKLQKSNSASTVSDVESLMEAWAFCQLLRTLHWERVLPNCPKVTNFFRSGLLKTALSCSVVGLSGTIGSVQRFLCGLKSSLFIIDGLDRVNADVPQMFLDQAWGNIKAVMPLLLTGLSRHVGKVDLDKRLLMLVDCSAAVSYAGFCYHLVKSSNLESEVLPWINFLTKSIRALERSSSSMVASMQIAACLGTIGFLRHSSGRSYSSIKWIKRLGHKQLFDKFSVAFRGLIDALCIGFSENAQSWPQKYVLMELLSLCLRFDFGPCVSNTTESSTLSSWCIPDEIFESVMRHHGTTGSPEVRSSIQQKEQEYHFHRTNRSVLKNDGELTMSPLMAYSELPSGGTVGSDAQAYLGKLQEGAKLIENGLEIVRESVTCPSTANLEKGVDQGSFAIRRQVVEKLKAVHERLGDVLNKIQG